ncbi:hypothetical protein ACJ5NV_20210 [Loktanella agnita]
MSEMKDHIAEWQFMGEWRVWADGVDRNFRLILLKNYSLIVA